MSLSLPLLPLSYCVRRGMNFIISARATLRRLLGTYRLYHDLLALSRALSDPASVWRTSPCGRSDETEVTELTERSAYAIFHLTKTCPHPLALSPPRTVSRQGRRRLSVRLRTNAIRGSRKISSTLLAEVNRRLLVECQSCWIFNTWFLTVWFIDWNLLTLRPALFNLCFLRLWIVTIWTFRILNLSTFI